MRTKLFLLTITVSAFLLVGWIGIHSFWLAPVEPELALAASQVHVNSEEGIVPMQISIPTINVHAKVEQVGIAKSGRIAVPRTYQTAAWYKYGVRPGDYGSAILLGHVDNGFGLAGVFNRLRELSVGDEIIVQDVNGTERTFIVLGKELVSASTTLDHIVTRDERELILITCSGIWLKDKKMYTDRLLVRAVMAP